MYEIKRTIGPSHLGADKKLSIGRAIDLMQDCCCFQLDSEKTLTEYFIKNHVGMYLVSRQLDLFRMPICGETVTVRTSIYEIRSIYGFRNTLIFDENGGLCVASFASGAFVDLTNGRPVKVAAEITDTVPFDPAFEMEYTSRKVTLPKVEPKQCGDIIIPRYMIDQNNHINNARYEEIAESLLPRDFEIKRARLDYRRPAKEGEHMTPYLFDCGDTMSVDLKVGDESCCAVEFARK